MKDFKVPHNVKRVRAFLGIIEGVLQDGVSTVQPVEARYPNCMDTFLSRGLQQADKLFGYCSSTNLPLFYQAISTLY